MTKLLKTTDISIGAKIIKDGGLVAFPTETVYGLGANATCKDAVEKIFAAKNRPKSNPLIVHFYSIKHLLEYIPTLNRLELRLLKKLKHALTLVVPKPENCKIVDFCLAGQNTVAVRIPSCKLARKFIQACSVPLAAPSANTSTRPSSSRMTDVLDDLDQRIDAIFMGKQTKIGVESTVVQVQQTQINILRLGGVTAERIQKISGLPVRTIFNSEQSPGSKHKHYTPSVPLFVLSRHEILQRHGGNDVVLTMTKNKKYYPDCHVIVLGNSARRVQQNLFPAMREAEKFLFKQANQNTVSAILVENMPDTSDFTTIRERLQRASTVKN